MCFLIAVFLLYFILSNAPMMSFLKQVQGCYNLVVSCCLGQLKLSVLAYKAILLEVLPRRA